MQVKLKDIAKRTGFSITTISRALAGYTDVNEETRKYILETAASMGYQPHQIAQQLRDKRTRTIGMVIPTSDFAFSNDFFGQLIRGIGDAASVHHHDVLISTHPPGDEEMAAYRRLAGGNRVDGMILARTRLHDPRIAYLQAIGKPFVVSGRASPGEVNDFPFIDVDSQSGIHMAVQHLTGLGHRQIGLIASAPDLAYTTYRINGYRDALTEADLPFREEYVVYGDMTRSSGDDNAAQLLQRFPELTAIVACNDLMAIGAIEAVKRNGLRVGQDIAITGFDDIPAAEYTYPPLTTVRQPIFEIGQRLARMLIDLSSGKTPAHRQLIIPCELMVRTSSGGVRTQEV